MIALMKVCARFLLALLFFSPQFHVVTAHADPLRYAVAATSNVWFYSAESEENKLFLIPETYYVRVLNEGEGFTAVEYLVNDGPYRKIMGYCETSALTFVDFIPARPFLRKEITVSYSLPADGGGTDAFEDVFGTIERTFVYYGMRYMSGQRYAYVLLDDTFGYIPIEEEPVFEHNDDFLSVPSPPEVNEEASGEGGLGGVQIAAICIAGVAAAAVGFFILRGRRSSLGQDSGQG